MPIGPRDQKLTQDETAAVDQIIREIDAQIEHKVQASDEVRATFAYAPGLTSEMRREITRQYENVGWGWVRFDEIKSFTGPSYIVRLGR